MDSAKINMETKTITMPLTEYEKIFSENERMKKALRNRDLVSFEWKYQNMGMGWMRNTWNVATKDELVKSLIDSLKKYQDLMLEVDKKYWDLKQQETIHKYKRWWKF